MLVLSRKVGESIMVGQHKVTVIAMGGGKVKIGVDAPADVPVHRLEVAERIAKKAAELIGKEVA